MNYSFCPYCMNPVTPGQPCKVCGLTAGSYTPLPHHLPPGTVLKERYLIGRVLGEGGFGITYIGCDLQLEVKLAIKEYFPVNKVSRNATADLTVSRYGGTTSDQFDRDLDRFLKEARTMAKLSKQHTIVTVHDFFRDNQTAYIVMEYIDGTTFKDLTAQRGGRIPAWELLHLIEPLFFALQTMHDAGLIHRDISPENLMLEDGAVRLLDFGCARDLESDRTMTISLKHSYAPVEQYQGKGQGPWTDVYALGSTIYYCLTGIKPPQAMDRLVDDELILPRKLGVDLIEAQEKALLHAMRVRPRQRYQSMTEFHTALYEGIEKMPKSPVLMTVGSAAIGAAAGAAAGAAVAAAAGGQTASPAEIRAAEAAAVTADDEQAVPLSEDSMDRTFDPAGDTADTADESSAESDATGSGASGDDASESGSSDNAGSENAILTWIKSNRLIAGIGTAVIVLVLIIGIAFAVSSGSGKGSRTADTDGSEESAESSGTEAETSSGDSDTYELIGTTAYVLSGTEEALRAALEDDAAASVIVSDNDIDLTEGILYINKPLTIQTNVWTGDSVIVGEGGELTIDCGQSDAEGLTMHGLLSTRDGGTITIRDGSGIYCETGGVLFLESWDDLALDDGASLSLLEQTNDDGETYTYYETGLNYDSCFAIDEEELFADAYEAASEMALRAAMYDDSVSAVTVTADITLTEEFTQVKPVRIAEGVTVTALSDKQAVSEDGETIISIEEAPAGTESVYNVWNISGTVLINHGTLRGCVNTLDPDETAWSGDEPYLINDGTLTVSGDTCRGGCLVNLEDGTFNFMYGSTNCQVVNLGTFLCSSTVSGEGLLDITDPGFVFCNSGTLQIETGDWQPDDQMIEFGTCVLLNLSGGSIRIGENAQFANDNSLYNYGSIVLTDNSSLFLNHRYLALAAGSTLDVRVGQFDNNGIIQSAETASYLSNDGTSGHWMYGLMYDTGWAETVTEVTDASELEAALSDAGVSAIWCTEEITWEGDLDISGKTLFGDRYLTISGGDLILSGSDTSAELGGVNLSGGNICLSDDATMLLNEFDDGAQEVGTLEITGGALLMTTGDTYLADMEIVIEDEGSMLCNVPLENCTVQVGDGGVLLGVTSNSEDDTSTVTISSGGLLSYEQSGASVSCSIVNEGTIELYGDVTIGSGGSLTNYGELYVGQVSLWVQGTFDNQGTVTLESESESAIYDDGGTISGYDDVQKEGE